MRSSARSGNDYVEFMLHSSEFMPGGSPTFKDRAAIEGLYQDLEQLFTRLSDKTVGMTLAEFYQYKNSYARRGHICYCCFVFEKGVLNANKIIKKIKASELSSMTSVSPYKSKRSIDVSSSAFLFRRAYAIIETKKRALPLRRGSPAKSISQ